MKDIIIKKYKILKSEKDKIKGIMFQKNVKNRYLFVFEDDIKYNFHSFFCPKFDIIFLDKGFQVNEYYEINEWKIIKPKYKYRYVLEAEPGFIKKYRIRKKDKIIFK